MECNPPQVYLSNDYIGIRRTVGDSSEELKQERGHSSHPFYQKQRGPHFQALRISLPRSSRSRSLRLPPIMADLSRRCRRFLAICSILFVQSTIASPMFTNANFNLEVGRPFRITWFGEAGAVTVGLAERDRTKVEKITS